MIGHARPILLPISYFLLLASYFFSSGCDKQPTAEAKAPGVLPVRIVSLAPNLTEIVFALGLDERLVAVTDHCNYPAEATSKAKVGTFWQPNLEAIVGARPDLVLTLDMAQQRVVSQRLERMGYRCLTLRIETIDELMRAIETLGQTLGCAEEAGRWRALMTERMVGAGRSQGPRPRVLWVVQRQPLRVAGQRTFVNEMIELAGGQNAIGPTIYQYPPIGGEQVLARRPDVIIEPATVDRVVACEGPQAEFWGRFKDVPAVAGRQIYQVNADVVSRLGPRIADGVEQIAQCLRPQTTNYQPTTNNP
jgi:iron complex transport system substrate-binding protein